jgi:hypothetical protein
MRSLPARRNVYVVCSVNSFLYIKLIPGILTLSNPIFLPTAYSPALICFGRERGWWITCNYPTVLKDEKHGETERLQPALSVG